MKSAQHNSNGQGRAASLLLNVRLFLSGSATLFHFHLGRDVEVAEFEKCDNLMLRLPLRPAQPQPEGQELLVWGKERSWEQSKGKGVVIALTLGLRGLIPPGNHFGPSSPFATH